MRRSLSFALLLLAALACAAPARADMDQVQIAQAQPAPASPSAQTPAAPAPAATAADQTTQAEEEPIGSVATLTGKASVTRNDKPTPLQLKDDIYLNDVVQTSASSSLGITFSDGTTFSLKASSQITIDSFVYEDGGKNNTGLFGVAKGSVAFVAAQVAKTGNMQITTPTATLGVRGTSGLVEVPAGAAAANANNVNIKLYPDSDGHVGRIEVNDRAGARLGFLSQGASGFTIRPGTGGARFAAVPLAITPQMMQRDQGFVRQVQSVQTVGRRVFDEQRAFRRANPGYLNPNRPIRQPGQLRPNGLPGQNRPGQPQNGLPGQNRPGQPQNGLPGQNRPGQPQNGQPGQNRPGQPQQQAPGAPGRQGQGPQQPGQPAQATQPNRTLPGQPGGAPLPGQQPRTGQNSPAGTPGQATAPAATPSPRAPAGEPAIGRPGGAALPNQPPRLQQPGGARPLPQQPAGQLRQPAAPRMQQPRLPARPALQPPRRAAPAPKGKKPPQH